MKNLIAALDRGQERDGATKIRHPHKANCFEFVASAEAVFDPLSHVVSSTGDICYSYVTKPIFDVGCLGNDGVEAGGV